jgi:hypothetical protein
MKNPTSKDAAFPKPLTDELIRLECLKLAHVHGSASQILAATEKAEEYFQYVKNGPVKKQLPLT